MRVVSNHFYRKNTLFFISSKLNDYTVLFTSDILEDITDHTDRSNQRLIKETRHIRIIDRKSATCCMLINASFLVQT